MEKQVVIRATDSNWHDGEFHDRLVLYPSSPDSVYLVEGYYKPGPDPAAPSIAVIGGIARGDDQRQLTLLAKNEKQQWVKLCAGLICDESHIEFRFKEGGVAAKITKAMDDLLLEKIGQDSISRLDMAVENREEKRARLKVVG